jgi:hypothetical protein
MPVTVPLLAFGAYPGRAWLRPHGAGLRVTRRHVPVTRSIHRMTVSLAAALLAEATGIMLLRYRLGRAWLRHPVTLVFLAAVAYQGLSTALLAFPPLGTWDNLRQGIAPGFTDTAALLESAGMLALVIAYLMTQPQRAMPAMAGTDIRALARALDWRLLTAACAPLAVLTYEGRGANDGMAMDGAATPLASDLAATLFSILIVTAAFALVLRRGRGWFLPVLTGQSILLAAAGERAPVIMDAIALILMLAHAGLRPSQGQLRTAAALTVVAVLGIMGARAEHGRSVQYSNSGLGARVAALGAGVASVAGNAPAAQQEARPGLAAQFATRLDGDAFAGGILQAQALGQPRLSAAYVPESLLITVPSALWPSKLAHGNALNPVQVETNDFGLQQQVNFLPTVRGVPVAPVACAVNGLPRAALWLGRAAAAAVLHPGAVGHARGRRHCRVGL